MRKFTIKLSLFSIALMFLSTVSALRRTDTNLRVGAWAFIARRYGVICLRVAKPIERTTAAVTS
jgi:hypothetical protein